MSTAVNGSDFVDTFAIQQTKFESHLNEPKESSMEDQTSQKTIQESPTTSKIRRRRTLQRESSLHIDETFEYKQDINDELISGDNNIFPSPIAITQEEALRETCCHSNRQQVGSRHQLSSTRSSGVEDGTDDSGSPTVNGNIDTGSQQRRREVEKPPRLQKQASRDRLTYKQSNNHTNISDNCGSAMMVNGNGQRAESTECLDSMGVDVHEFLVKALQSNPRDRSILLKLEHDMVKFVNNQSIEFMRFPEMTSYHRMLVHRVAAYFGMDHNIDAKGKSVIINKTKNTRIPDTKFNEHILNHPDLNASQEDMRRRSILKRMQNCQSLDHSQVVEATNKVKTRENWKYHKQRSFEERENNYVKIRARIFNNQVQDEGGRIVKDFRNRDKERVISQWAKRPWNSTDLSSLPSRNLISPPATSSGSKMSGSGITLLSRHNTRDDGSTSSSASSVFLTHPQTSEYNNATNGQQPNDDWSDHSEPPPISNPLKNFVNQSGNPYVSVEGYPLMYNLSPVPVPTYPMRPLPVQYHQLPHAYNMTQHNVMPYESANSSVSKPANLTEKTEAQSSAPLDGSEGQNPAPPPEGSIANSGASTPLQMYPHPAMYPPQPQSYPQAPVHLLYYPATHFHNPPVQPLHPTNVPTPGDVTTLQNDVNNRMQGLSVKEGIATSTSDVTSAVVSLQRSSGDDVTKAGLPKDLRPEENSQKVSTNLPQATNSVPNQDSQNIEKSNRNNQNQTITDFYQQQGSNVVSTVHTGPGSVTYYTPQEITHYPKPPPLMPGVHPGVMTPSNPYMTSNPVYPCGGVLRPPHDGKDHIGVKQTSSEYFLPQAQPSLNFAYHPTQAMYYVIPNTTSNVQHYQGQAVNQTPNGPHCPPSFVYPPPHHGYVNPHPAQTQATHFAYPNEALNGGFPGYVVPGSGTKKQENEIVAGHDDVTDDLVPLLVTQLKGDITSPQLNSFAARHQAKIVQFQSSDPSIDTPHSDVYLLFSSLGGATEALASLESESSKRDETSGFQLSHISDAIQRREIVSQIRGAAAGVETVNDVMHIR